MTTDNDDPRLWWQTWEIYADTSQERLLGRVFRVAAREKSLDTMWVEDVLGGYRYGCPPTTILRVACNAWGPWMTHGNCRLVPS